MKRFFVSQHFRGDAFDGSKENAKNPGRRNLKASQEAALKGSLNKIKQKFLVMSGKGGVGKTSVSINLALALSRKGFKVGIIDVDIHGPDVPRMLGLDGILTVNERNRVIPMPYSDNLSVISIESMLPSKDEAIIWRGAMKHSAIRQFIGDVEWGDLDFLIIDSRRAPETSR